MESSTRRSISSEGGAFGVGSDSNIEIGVAAELKQLEYAQRLGARQRNVCAVSPGSTGRALYQRALAGGAQALKRQNGALAVGALADFVSLRDDHPTLIGRSGDEILDAWIFAIGNPLVDCVWSGGRKVVAGGRHVGREPIAKRYGAAMRRLLQ